MRHTPSLVITVALIALAAFSLGFMFSGTITTLSLEYTKKLFGLEFSPAERDSMLSTIQNNNNSMTKFVRFHS